MKKAGARPHLKRVSAAPKERRCGVPCTLLVASWCLFILLLLTSSISHRDDEQAARVLEDSDFATQQELTGVESLLGRGDVYHPYGDGGGEDFVSSSVIISSDNKEGHHHLSHFTSNEDRREQQQPASVSGVVLPTKITFQELGEPIDALQYAEYGAGLLQKSGVAEDSSKICVHTIPGGTSCRVLSHNRELSGENCLWRGPVSGPASASTAGLESACPKDVLPAEEQERCHDASSYGGDLVAEIVKPGGESYLVCQSHPVLAKTAVCGVACSAQSECVLQGWGANPEDCARSDSLITETHEEEGHGRVEVAAVLSVESVSSSELPSSVETDVHPSSEINDPQHDDGELSAPLDVVSDSNSVSQQDVGESRKQREEGNADDILKPVLDVEDVMDKNGVAEKTDVTPEESAVNVEFLFSLESEVAGLFSLESEVAGRESLVLPVEDGIREEELDFDDILLPLSVETKLLIKEPGRLQRVGSVLSLDEYKRSILESQRKNGNQVNLSSVQVQQKARHTDESYNYASASHGAKVLASNKDAKGAGHILTSDKDKYLRNPCGTEDKYVVLELSEETFVDTIVISNFEFHSSNLKDFEVLGSPVYPTKDWISLGTFQAENVRQRQKFSMEDPTLVRHLMIKMLSHWGSEFFCTLSIVEVFGVDVIRNLLDDWIALEKGDNDPRVQGNSGVAALQEESATPGSNGQLSDEGGDLDIPFRETLSQPSETGTGSDHQGSGAAGGRDSNIKGAERVYEDEDSRAGSAGDISAQEVHHVLGGKPPSESVLKILMQRVKSLELNQTFFDLYLGDMNQKYKVMLSELDKDLALVTERLRNQTLLTASLAMRVADRELQRKEDKLNMEHRFAQIASNFTDNMDFMRWQIQSMERREITAILLAVVCMILSALLHLIASCLPRRRPALQDLPLQPIIEAAVIDDNLGEIDNNNLGEIDNSLGEIDNNLGRMDDSFGGIDSHKLGGTQSTSGGMDCKLDNLSVSAVCHRSSSFILYLACGLTILVLSV